MTFAEDMVQACAAHFVKNEKHAFQVQVLDTQRMPVFSGKAFFDEHGLEGTFWPTEQIAIEKSSATPAFLKHADGREFLLQNFSKCRTTNHYHFNVTT